MLSTTLRLNLGYLKIIRILYCSFSLFLKNKQKNKCICIHTINHNKNEDENEK